MFRNNDSKDLAEKLEAALSLSKEYKKAEGEKLRQYAEQNHRLENLMKELIAATTPVISKKTNEINLLDL